MDMNIVCLDLEGVLVPEIWIAFSEATGIPELKRTTRDEPDYDKLMNFRLNILKIIANKYDITGGGCCGHNCQQTVEDQSL